MQLAINVVIFFLGLYLPTLVASKPRKAREDLSRNVTRQIQKIISAICGRGQPEEGVDVEQEPESIEDGAARLYTKEQVESEFDMNAWQRLAYEDFKTTILAKETGLKTFPCVYATMGYRAGDHRYVFLESDDPSEPRNVRIVAPALRAYLRMSNTLGDNTSMVIMAAPTEGDPKSVEEYNHSFWEMLRGLRIWDSQPWPKQFPQDTGDEKWTYCFDGTPLFPVALTPAHQKRWSRHAPVPLIALQPKWVLDKLLSTPEKREAATGKVRRLLKQYDQTEISPDLTSYGDVGTSEVHQLCLRDENETADVPFQDFDKGGSSVAFSRRPSLESGRSSCESRRSNHVIA
ncbi:hypothetical protein CLAFUW4_14323 [Fulvia fulva]|uniref:Uncharacterized protein n=1 Tax=Passalora fulva TaxID=5499 RepID=A0A9Q8UWM0_PASFU|nr:uncharacterized protein CLAFUR5_14156 [Fulvia fulva]UJO25194.1 hypothetical protein CLAFUR5_14156 [Fulvia fulva]WPV22825.1 hypothetical protein CLAFUW4_14323 [Fulvia fulva]